MIARPRCVPEVFGLSLTTEHTMLPSLSIIALVSFLQAPLTLNAEPAWTAHVDPGDQIFPAMVLAMSAAKSKSAAPDPFTPDDQRAIEEEAATRTLGDPDGWVYVTLRAPADNTPVRVTISCPDVMETSTYKGVIPKGDKLYGIAPKIKWKYKDLARVRQPIPTNVVFKVKLGDGEEEEDVQVCTLHTINDCPFLHLAPNPDGEGFLAHNLSFTFAAYVNEDHPWVDLLLRDALNSGVIERFVGYQANTEEEVFRQVYAIWNVLQKRDITYSDITRVSSRAEMIPSQHVRFLDESIQMKQANCVDGSVLIASVLRKIGIDVFLMLTPRHCYIGFFTDAERKNMVGLETTMLGQARKCDFDRTAKLRALMLEAPSFDDVSFNSFNAALDTGTKALDEDIKKTLAGEFQYLQVIIKDIRDQGIRAIPYLPPDKADKLPSETLNLDDLRIKK